MCNVQSQSTWVRILTTHVHMRWYKKQSEITVTCSNMWRVSLACELSTTCTPHYCHMFKDLSINCVIYLYEGQEAVNVLLHEGGYVFDQHRLLFLVGLIPEQIHCTTLAFTCAHACVPVDKALESKLKLLCGVDLLIMCRSVGQTSHSILHLLTKQLWVPNGRELDKFSRLKWLAHKQPRYQLFIFTHH